MLTKILVTVLVIVACYIYLRYQRQKAADGNRQGSSRKSAPKKTSFSAQFRWLAGGLVLLTASATIGIFIYGWVDDRRVLTVKITNPLNGNVVSYQVYKGDMQERSFETLKGQRIRISNNERIEVSEAP